MEISIIIIPVEGYDNQDERLDEIVSLTESAGAKVANHIFVKINKIVPSTYIGSGKIEEIKQLCASEGSDLVVFDGDLSPSQTINLSDALDGIKVVDRTTLILDIFASRARSSEGKLQVELAQLKYIYPRLKGKGAALSRLGGGIGTRGPGESKLESDRRHIRRRINYLEERLLQLEKRRTLQVERRNKNGIFKVALVGYTNTGKSTLLNALTGSQVLAENKLFATLDPTVKKLQLNNFSVLLSDTVGFIKNIPTTLIEAFKSTLETAVEADLILIVCDALSNWPAQLDTTNLMLDELKATAPRIIVFNKCESINDFSTYPSNAVFISAKEKKGLEGLQLRISTFFEANYFKDTYLLPYSKLRDVHSLKNYFEYYNVEYFDNYIKLDFVVNNSCKTKLEILKK